MQYGRYRIIKELGKGTMGVVYEAHDPQIDRLVALKVLRPDRVVSEAFVERFLKEARAIGRLSHPQIVTVYDVGEDHGTIYIAMEYLHGQPFNQVIRSGPLSIERSIKIACQVADALDYAHGKGIVHRDIKPSNIILTEDDQVKLTDFGIARMEEASMAQQTQAGEILGTPVYMAPEQVMGKTVDGRADLYALGVLLYEMIIGRRPFNGDSIAAIFRAITQDTPQAPADINPFIKKSLSALMLKSLAKLPEKRFQTGKQMTIALSEVLDQGDLDISQKKDISKKSTRDKALFSSIALVLVIVLALVGYWLFYDRPSEDPIPPKDTTTETTEGGNDTPTNPPPPPIKLATLNISSDPLGAQVFVDNSFRGKTPLEVGLNLGKYELRLNLPNHLEWEAQIDLTEPGETPLHIPLRPVK